MPTVLVYGFSGEYSGESDYDWAPPEAGVRHNCMLFLRQESSRANERLAHIEIARFGFLDVAISRSGALDVEILSSSTYRGFAGFYEEALREGSALVFYPNAKERDLA